MKSYLITDPKYYSTDPRIFETTLNNVIQLIPPDMVCFRDKSSQNTEQLIEAFMKVCNQHHIVNSYINTHIVLAKKYNAKGVHLTSSQFNEIKLAKNLKLKVIISCHNEEEIQKAIYEKADMITYSPIFETPNKGKPKGLLELTEVVKKFNIPIIALGGIISKEHTDLLKQTNVYGFASIRYFID